MMYANMNMPPNVGPNVSPNIAPNVAPMPDYSMPVYTAPAYDCGYGYAAPVFDDCRNDFVLIVVLFILLIIVGACVCGFSDY